MASAFVLLPMTDDTVERVAMLRVRVQDLVFFSSCCVEKGARKYAATRLEHTHRKPIKGR